MEQKYYAYYHVRHDKNCVFYVGVGTKQKGNKYQRSRKAVGRNPIWKNIVTKTTWNAVIIKEFDTKLESLRYETRLIQLFGRKMDGGQLANIIDDTADNYTISDNCRESKWRPIYQYSMEGIFIAEYSSVKKAGEAVHCCASQISSSSIKEKGSCKGFQWRHYKYDKIEPMSPQKRITYQFDLEGNFIKEWDSVISAAKGLNMSPSNIACVIKNRSISAGNFLWSYDKKQIPLLEKYKVRDKYKKLIYQYDKNYNLVNTFSGVSEAAKRAKAHTSNISDCCLKKKGKNTCVGFIWSYEPLTKN